MRGDNLGKLAIELLSVPPLIYRLIRRKLVNITLADTDTDIKGMHFEIMRVLKDDGTLHPAEIGDKLLVAKAQMTHLVDRLVDLGFVNREMCPNDRRTINLTLTEKGHKVLDDQDNLVINAISENMTSLSDKELEELTNSLRHLKDTLFKLQ